jgi:ribonuclease VapC
LILDSSALLAVIFREPEAPVLIKAMTTNDCAISAANFLESRIVIQRRRKPELLKALDDLIAGAPIEIVPFDASQAEVASGAYEKYGKGSGHKAGLNFGDCFSYALAKQRDEPLLAVGPEFADVGLLRA